MPGGRTILLHPGFHKTGTSSIQHFLWSNRETLAPVAEIVMLRHLKPVTQLCHGFSKTQNPTLLLDMADALEECLADISTDDPRALIISCEALSGHLPGWPNVDSYASAPILIHYISGYLRARFAGSDLRVVLTTRKSEDWLFSTYRHHLRGQRLTLEAATFSRKYKGAADFSELIALIAEALSPLPVETLPLEISQAHPLGPGGAFIQFADLPSEITRELTPVGVGNSGPENALWQRYLELNRSKMPDSTVASIKLRLAEEARVGGWKPAAPDVKTEGGKDQDDG